MSVTLAAAREYRMVWPRWKPQPGDGVVVVVDQQEATLDWADAVLGRRGNELLMWTAVDGDVGMARQALALADCPGVIAATLAPAGVDQRALGVALDVAVSLADRRRVGADRPLASLTSWSLPTPPRGAVRVPHLVTMRCGDSVTDRAVWELMSQAEAQSVLGHPLPDLSFAEAYLDRLLALRGAVRSRRVPLITAGARLLSLLADDRELTIKLVYERPSLFRALVGAPNATEPGELDE